MCACPCLERKSSRVHRAAVTETPAVRLRQSWFHARARCSAVVGAELVSGGPEELFQSVAGQILFRRRDPVPGLKVAPQLNRRPDQRETRLARVNSGNRKLGAIGMMGFGGLNSNLACGQEGRKWGR